MKTLQPYQARTGAPLGAPVPASTEAQVDAAADAAGEAFTTWAASDGPTRARLLRGLAQMLEDDRAALVTLADDETALGPVRLNGELDRTAFQLRRFCLLYTSRCV